MRTATFFAASVLARSVLSFCLSDADAQTIGNNFAHLVSNYSATFANEVLAPTFSDQIDSVITLMDGASQPQKPTELGSVTFPSKAAYMAAQSGQPDIPFEILNTWHDCNAVIIRWLSAQTPQQVQGFTAMEVVVKPGNPLQKPVYQISKTFGEFNSGAWLVNLGNPQCKNES